MAQQAAGPQDRTHQGIAQPDAERQGDHLRTAHAQHPPGLGRAVHGQLVSMVFFFGWLCACFYYSFVITGKSIIAWLIKNGKMGIVYLYL